MIGGAFEHRSGRVIALGRASLASFYLLASMIAPGSAPEAAALVQLLLTIYAAASVGWLFLSWSNWWLEERLGAPAHIGDLFVLGSLLTLSTDGYASPIFVFFIFLVLSASTRWGWRAAMLTAGAVGLLFAAGTWIAVATPGGESFEPQRFVIRSANLVIMSAMLAWFGVNHAGRAALERGSDLYPRTGEPPVARAMRHVAQRLGAGRVVFTWSVADEPWRNLALVQAGHFSEEVVGSEGARPAIAHDLAGAPFLFDSVRGRVLQRAGTRRVAAAFADPVDPALVERFAMRSGIAIPVRTKGFEGEIFALGVPGLCGDDLATGERIAEEVGAAFERASLLVATEDAALARARLGLARDLHDNVAQILAGLSLKLRAIRNHKADADFVDAQIAAIELDLVQQQQDIRSLISMLRQPTDAIGEFDLYRNLAALAERLASQWGVEIRLGSLPHAMPLSPGLRHEVNQMIREGVANAVRHGAARLITISGRREGGGLHLELMDDGNGFGFEGELDHEQMHARKAGPRSLRERVGSLGGTLKLVSGAQGARLMITIPNGGN